MPKTVQEYLLCSQCAERQGTGAGNFTVVEGRDCFICEGLMDRVPRFAAIVAKKAARFEFKTFAVGIIAPQAVQEREDELRADLKLRGKEGVKGQAAREIEAFVSKKMRKKVDKARPDLSVLVGLGQEEVSVSSRPLFFYGRYTKPRGLPQKRELCPHCGGRGCEKCGATGFERKPSVEGHLRKKLSSLCGSEKMTFTWIGSEDRKSRVYPPGRPFVVELKSPLVRRLPRKFAIRYRGGLVSVSRGKLLPSKPTGLPSFRFRTQMMVEVEGKVGAEQLRELAKRFHGAEVRFDRPHDRPVVKVVHRAKAEKRGRTIVIDAVLDGGLPVKRFVSGELVSPSVSEVLKTQVRCRSFDIREVKETGKLQFAEISRVPQKDAVASQVWREERPHKPS